MTFKDKKLEEFDKKFNCEIIFGKNSKAENTLKEFISQALDEQRDEFIKCLPGTTVLDLEFYDDKTTPKFNQWLGADNYKQQYLDNLKKAKLI